MANSFTVRTEFNEYSNKYAKRVYMPIFVWGLLCFIALLGNSAFLPQIVNIISVIALILIFLSIVFVMIIVKKRQKELIKIQSDFKKKDVTLIVEDKKIYLSKVDAENVLDVSLDDKTNAIFLHRVNREVTTFIRVDVMDSVGLKADLENLGIEVLSIEDIAYKDMQDVNRVRRLF